MHTLASLRTGYTAIVIGASGGVGSAIASLVELDPACARVLRLSRGENASFDICDEACVAAAAARIAEQHGEVDLIFNATGALVIDGAGPEKSIRALDPEAMARQFRVNAIGPALLIKHFAMLLPKGRRGLFGTLSARVGSIGDNGLGGWISYRAAKAAQNQIVKTAAIEIARTRPQTVLAALHPGTVETRLSDAFAGRRKRLKPEQSAAMLLDVLDSLTPQQSGGFFAYDGSAIEW
jgi:NAD(P)-dependent dehydrogenase (short-subunit alcohol dehydrogenase family)